MPAHCPHMQPHWPCPSSIHPPTPARAPSIFNGASRDKPQAAAVQESHDARPGSGAGTINNSKWLARRAVPVSIPSLFLSLLLLPSPSPGPGLGPRDTWMDGQGRTHRLGCCTAVSHSAARMRLSLWPPHLTPLLPSRLSQDGLEPEASSRLHLHLPPTDARVRTRSINLNSRTAHLSDRHFRRLLHEQVRHVRCLSSSLSLTTHMNLPCN